MFELIVLLGIIIIYFAPTIEAKRRKHKNEKVIGVINLFFGWTVIGWIICLAWSQSCNV